MRKSKIYILSEREKNVVQFWKKSAYTVVYAYVSWFYGKIETWITQVLRSVRRNQCYNMSNAIWHGIASRSFCMRGFIGFLIEIFFLRFLVHWVCVCAYACLMWFPNFQNTVLRKVRMIWPKQQTPIPFQLNIKSKQCWSIESKQEKQNKKPIQSQYCVGWDKIRYFERVQLFYFSLFKFTNSNL